MQGKLRKNALGRWEIANEFGECVELRSGDVIELYNHGLTRWVTTTIEHSSRDYYSTNYLVALFVGALARTTDTPRFTP